MDRGVTLPPQDAWYCGRKLGGWWHRHGDRIVCDLCPRGCSLRRGDRGFCKARRNFNGRMVLDVYGHAVSVCVDPVEKKPLNHFYPGSSVFSFGTIGCNLGCKFCQAWSITKSRTMFAHLTSPASPRQIAEAAQRLGCRSVAFTYNEPVIWAEYAIDTARWCRRLGLKVIVVTAGYINAGARPLFFRDVDAVNVDLKGLTDDFYQRLTLSHLQPVLDTLQWIKQETDVWLEVTNLIIPGENDARDDIQRLSSWIAAHLGAEVPLHFTQFRPHYRLSDSQPTPPATLIDARELALHCGLKYVYTGNVEDPDRQSTYCPACGWLLIERNVYDLGRYNIRGGRCAHCRQPIAGLFEDALPSRKRRLVSIDPWPPGDAGDAIPPHTRADGHST